MLAIKTSPIAAIKGFWDKSILMTKPSPGLFANILWTMGKCGWTPTWRALSGSWNQTAGRGQRRQFCKQRIYNISSKWSHAPSVSKLMGSHTHWWRQVYYTGRLRSQSKSSLQKRKWRAQFQDDGSAWWEELPFVPAPSIRSWMGALGCERGVSCLNWGD